MRNVCKKYAQKSISRLLPTQTLKGVERALLEEWKSPLLIASLVPCLKVLNVAGCPGKSYTLLNTTFF